MRESGSRSTGATNVFRVLGARLAIIVLIIDIAKGFFACYLASRVDFGDSVLLSNQLSVLGGLAAILGHLFPVLARFRGGKGIATGAGMLLYLTPLEVGFTLVVFVTVVLATRYVSLGSIMAAAFYSASILIEKYWLGYPVRNEITSVAVLLIFLVLLTHRSNIYRLISGTENRLGSGR